jgi:predicted PolB exonuclease-like 3'-5' exonuclease
MTNLFIDIETLPTDNQEFIDDVVSKISPPGNISKAETIAKWEEEKKPALIKEAIHKTGFDGGMGRICTIAWAFGDRDIQSVQVGQISDSEADILSAFAANVDAAPSLIWIGHNITGFDLRYIWQRCKVHGVSINIPHNAKPWGHEVYDTMYEWAGTGTGRKSLDFVCRALGIKGKDGFDGSMVWDAFQAGEYEKIAEYCRDDVRRVRDIYNKLKG